MQWHDRQGPLLGRGLPGSLGLVHGFHVFGLEAVRVQEEVGWLDGPAAGQQHGALHEVLELAHVAGPVVALEPLLGFRGEGQQVHAVALAEVGHEVPGQEDHVVAALAQGGQPQGDDVQAVEEVLPELAGLDRLLDVAVGGGQHAHVHAHGLHAAHAVDLALLQHAQQLGLQPQIHLRYLVQEHGPARGQLELAQLAGYCPGEGAFLVTEEFALQQVLGQGCAVDAHKGHLRAVAVEVQEPGEHLLAGSGLAGDEHRGPGLGHLLGQGQDPLHRRVPADDGELFAGSPRGLG